MLETSNCFLCNGHGRAYIIFKRTDGVGFYRCKKCGLVYASPRFDEQSLLNIYEGDGYVDEIYKIEWNGYEQWLESPSFIMENRKVDLISRYLSSGSVILDVGCSVGLFVRLAIERGYDCRGIEPSSRFYEIGVERFRSPIEHSKLEDYKCEPESLDCIVLWDVIEHLYDPIDMINRCYGLLKKGGYLIVHVPNHNSISFRYKTMLCKTGLRGQEFRHFGYPWHVYNFNKKSLGILMAKGNFSPISWQSWCHAVRTGETGLFTPLVDSISNRFQLSSGILCVAEKRPNARVHFKQIGD